ncbi:collectin-10 isoform X2 [Pseudochaenichthys georgianus]|uniref:collectin-10 isoform X2 n=1 Tax=Pseudochaenichthys georgianus TaxID=52239 RepID=UPI00146BC886|nr:collectin-10 isoform X2 [Pseudochaenichthys georgianus]
MGMLALCVFAAVFNYISTSTEVCTNALLPGAKGDQGAIGEVGEEGKLGKNGPPGLSGVLGEMGLVGEVGHTGKMGPIGERGIKGDPGYIGLAGFKGKPGTTCDCGRYRKVVGQLDVNVGKLRNAVKFLKNVILGLKETEERYYLLVKESKRFGEASMNCKLRGGTLAMPKTSETNQLMAEYDGTSGHVFADSSPLQGFTAWSQEEELNSPVSPHTNSSCVELLRSGTWSHVECEAAMFFICEFPKSRRRGAGGGGGRGRGRGTPALVPS